MSGPLFPLEASLLYSTLVLQASVLSMNTQPELPPMIWIELIDELMSPADTTLEIQGSKGAP